MNRKIDLYSFSQVTDEATNDMSLDALVESCSAVSVTSENKVKVYSEGNNMNTTSPSSPCFYWDTSSIESNTDQLHGDSSLGVPSSLTEDGNTLVCTPNKGLYSVNSCDAISFQ